MPHIFEQQLSENRKALGDIISVLETFSNVFEKGVKFHSLAHHLIGSMTESMWLKGVGSARVPKLHSREQHLCGNEEKSRGDEGVSNEIELI